MAEKPKQPKAWKMFTNCFLLFAGISLVVADSAQAQEQEENAELRNEIEQLRERLSEMEEKLEKKEEAKAEEAEEAIGDEERAQLKEEIKRDLGYDFVSKEDLSMVREQISKFHVGGDLKLRFYDHIRGDVNGDSDSLDTGAGLSSFYLYVNGQLSDRLSVQVEPHWSGGSTGATPRLDDIDAEGKETMDPSFEGFIRANFTYRLPRGYEVTAGVLRPRFTLDYGAQRFYHEEFHGSFLSANPMLGDWHDAGVELYKNYDFENFSLPVYLYYLNGGGPEGDNAYADYNEGPSGLVHVEPQIGPLTLLGSFGAGKWDDSNDHDFKRWSTGLEYQYKDFTLRSEFMGGDFENWKANGEDGETDGYYVKLFYNVLPDLELMAHYNVANHNFSGFFFDRSVIPGTTDSEDKYETWTLGATYTLAPSTDLILQYDMADQERDSGKELDYDRMTLGTRITW